MRQQLPAFDQIVLGNGYHGDLYVFGLTSRPPAHGSSLYLAAWQASNTGAWLAPGYNPLSFAPRIESLVVGNGNRGNLQLIGLMKQRIYLAAWQDNATGKWYGYGENPLDPPGSAWQAIALANGFENNLFIIGLGVDKRIYRGPSQNRDGAWDRSVHAIGNTQREWQAIAVGKGDQGNVQVLGLCENQVYLVARQAQQDGRWHDVNQRLGALANIEALAVGNGVRNELQVFALGKAQPGTKAKRLHLVAWQSSDTGEWHEGPANALGFAPPIESLATAKGNAGNLQVLGLGDERLNLAAWQDNARGTWHGYSYNPLGIQGGQWRTLALGTGHDGNLYVVTVGLDHQIYLGAYQTHRDGAWHAGAKSPLNEGDGRWNRVRLQNVRSAFEAIPDKFNREIHYILWTWDTWEPLPLTSHYQGMARYNDYYLLPFSAPKYLTAGVKSKIVALDRKARRELRRFELPEQDRPHPGGCQIVGDFLAVELESYEDGVSSILRFYWLGTLDAQRDPTLLPASIVVPKELQGVTAIAITDVGKPPNRYYLVALRSGRGGQELTCFKITDYLLDDPDLKLGEPIYIDTKFEVPGLGKKHGPDSINLLTDVNDNIYLVAMGGDANAPFEANFEDWADLWQVDLEARKLDFIRSKHIHTSAGLRLATGVHLRFGAGTWVEDSARMTLYASGPQGQLPAHGSQAKLNTNEFVPGGDADEPTTT